MSELTPLPVGFETFHRRSFVNYQLNRAHALGFAVASELRSAGQQIRTRDDCVVVFERLSAQATRAGRLRNATSYLRSVEFFTPPRSPDKLARYQAYRDLFDAAFEGTGIVRHEVPYETASLPAYRLASSVDPAGARTLGGLTTDHDWEKRVGRILDHFGIERSALVGMSMGGYWAIRAASREARITSVVSWPPVHDWLERVPTMRWCGRAPSPSEPSSSRSTRTSTARWETSHWRARWSPLGSGTTARSDRDGMIHGLTT